MRQRLLQLLALDATQHDTLLVLGGYTLPPATTPSSADPAPPHTAIAGQVTGPVITTNMGMVITTSVEQVLRPTPPPYRATVTRMVEDDTAIFGGRDAELPDYVRLFWVRHLSDTGQWGQLRQVLTAVVPSGTGWTQPWATARSVAEGSYRGYLSDLTGLWSHSDHGARCPRRCAVR